MRLLCKGTGAVWRCPDHASSLIYLYSAELGPSLARSHGQTRGRQVSLELGARSAPFILGLQRLVGDRSLHILGTDEAEQNDGLVLEPQ